MVVVTGTTSRYEVDVQVEDCGVTCREVVQEVVERLQLSERKKGAWHIYECWRGLVGSM